MQGSGQNINKNVIYFLCFCSHPDPIKAASQQERMEEARRRLQEKQDAKAAKFIEDKLQVSKTLSYGQVTILYNNKNVYMNKNKRNCYVHS